MLSKVLTAMLFIGCGSGEGKLGADTGAPALSEPSADQDTGVSQDSGGGASELDPTLPEVTLSRMGMLAHLEALMDVAQANDGHRSAGSSGYAASVDYVRGQLEGAGYAVNVAEFDIQQDQWDAPPEVSADGLPTLEYGVDFYVFGESGSGSVTAAVSAVDVSFPPPGDGSLSSGCEAEDFDGFESGRIALIQRGGCTFQTKVTHAEDAGASAVLIFNTGTSGMTDIYGGTLDADVENSLPVAAITYSVGEQIAALAPEATVTVVLAFSTVSMPTQNIFADLGGDASQTVVIGAHLDSVPAGPGINDNGSGVALTLEMALQLAEQGVSPPNNLRFAFWGGEELGLLGSFDYVLGLEDVERETIMANLNFDMVASPNPARMIYDGNGDTFGESGPIGSGDIEALFTTWFEANGLVSQETPFDGRSDYGPFIWTGIPAGGLFTGAEQPKTSGEAESYGGDAGVAYDPCYHRDCDTIENLDLDVLDQMAGAAVHATLSLAYLEEGLGRKARSVVRLPDWIPVSCAAHDRVWRR